MSKIDAVSLYAHPGKAPQARGSYIEITIHRANRVFEYTHYSDSDRVYRRARMLSLFLGWLSRQPGAQLPRRERQERAEQPAEIPEGLAVVAWRTVTGLVGRGSPISYDTARGLAEDLNSKYPDVRHWVEPAPQPEQPARDWNRVRAAVRQVAEKAGQE